MSTSLRYRFNTRLAIPTFRYQWFLDLTNLSPIFETTWDTLVRHADPK